MSAVKLQRGSTPGTPDCTDSKPIRVMLVDDHFIVRQGIRCCLEPDSGFVIVGEADNGRQAVEKARKIRPDVVLMDINLPELNGLQAAALLHRANPRIKVIMLTVYDSKEFIVRAIQSGASGFLLKNCPPREVIQGIKFVHAGGKFFASGISDSVLSDYMEVARQRDVNVVVPLSRRENEVLGLISRGLSNKEMAATLKVGIRSVETYRKRLIKKLNIHTMAGLTKYALANAIHGE